MKKILVVDDDMTFVAMIKAALDPKEYEVSSGANGVEGLTRITESKPDLILLDVMMPKMDGIEFLKQISEKYGEHKIPVLITSNVSSMDKISESVSLGIKGYFVKSNESLNGIIGMIERALAK